MPKVKCFDSAKLRGFVKEFSEKYFFTDGIILFCKLREVKFTAEKRFTVQQHCNNAKHTSCVNRAFAAESRQGLSKTRVITTAKITSTIYVSKNNSSHRTHFLLNHSRALSDTLF